ncbi:MAG: ribose-5-phosphate isomerase [Myxococcaceae bacterium]|nr:ribose-5-phosphate isomerase [Myxococcaceae bacterium]
MSWLVLALLAAAPTPGAMDPLVAGRPLSDRLEAVSARFLGTPYVVSPLGEGAGKDPDPLVRYDAVDCLTFVEQAIALSLAPSADGVVPLLTRIRYEGDRPDFEQRNHVMEAQWVPSNLKKGFLKDLTRTVGGERTVRVKKSLDDVAWGSKSGASLGLSREGQRRGDFEWDLIPAALAQQALSAAPNGTVVVVVRADRPKMVTRISHIGFLIHKKSGMFLRHASRSFGKVVDEPLANYLGRNLAYAKWTVEGVSLYGVQPAPLAPQSEP